MGVHINTIYTHCNSKWHCIYTPLLVIYSVGFAAVLVLRIRDTCLKPGSPLSSSSSSSTSAPGSWPPRWLRSDVCLWPSYVFLVRIFLPALLWPVIAATALAYFAGYLLCICLRDTCKGVVRDFRMAQSCCGIPLRRRAKETHDTGDVEHGCPSPACAERGDDEFGIAKPLPTHSYARSPSMSDSNMAGSRY